MLHYVLDHVYGAFVHRTKISPPFFSRGWGGTKLELLEKMIRQLFPNVEGENWPPMLVEPIWKTAWESKTACLKEGIFMTPCDEPLLNALPPESRTARVAFLVPKSVPPQNMSCVLHLAGKTPIEYWFILNENPFCCELTKDCFWSKLMLFLVFKFHFMKIVNMRWETYYCIISWVLQKVISVDVIEFDPSRFNFENRKLKIVSSIFLMNNYK